MEARVVGAAIALCLACLAGAPRAEAAPDASGLPLKASSGAPTSLSVRIPSFPEMIGAHLRVASRVGSSKIEAPASEGTRQLSDAPALYERGVKSVVLIGSQSSLGSGVVVSEDELMTNWHVVDGSEMFVVACTPKE